MNSKANKIFDLAKEIVDILSTMNQEELNFLKLQYEVAFKFADLKKMRERLEGNNDNRKTSNR